MECMFTTISLIFWHVSEITSSSSSSTTTTILQTFVWDYPVPEETFTQRHLSWSLTVLYQLPPSTTIRSSPSSIYMLDSLFVQPLSKSSLVYHLVWNPPLHTPNIFTQSLSSFCNTCPYHCNLFCCSSTEQWCSGKFLFDQTFVSGFRCWRHEYWGTNGAKVKRWSHWGWELEHQGGWDVGGGAFTALPTALASDILHLAFIYIYFYAPISHLILPLIEPFN